MNLISKLLGRNKGGAGADPQKPALGAREAIELARQGRIPVQEMLGFLVASNLFIPLVEPPSMDAEIIKSWKPATVSKEDGSQWLVAFTDAEFSAHFTKYNQNYSHGMSVQAQWLLRAVPPAHGLVVNMGTPDSMFEWSADGLSSYKANVLA